MSADEHWYFAASGEASLDELRFGTLDEAKAWARAYLASDEAVVEQIDICSARKEWVSVWECSLLRPKEP
jgi:hypothetical protein